MCSFATDFRLCWCRFHEDLTGKVGERLRWAASTEVWELAIPEPTSKKLQVTILDR